MIRLSRAQLAGGALTAVVAVSVAAGLFVTGLPADERQRRLDDRRVADLTSIAVAADVFWTRHGRVPASLEELGQEPGASVSASDPETGEAYEFRPGDGPSFQICARFAQPSDSTRGDAFWRHGGGRQCFRRDARTLPVR